MTLKQARHAALSSPSWNSLAVAMPRITAEQLTEALFQSHRELGLPLPKPSKTPGQSR
jgi:hypothetical protein